MIAKSLLLASDVWRKNGRKMIDWSTCRRDAGNTIADPPTYLRAASIVPLTHQLGNLLHDPLIRNRTQFHHFF
jgi:hypothetical protein